MSVEAQNDDIELPSGTTLLREQYHIGRRLSQGGFGITYLARDSLMRKVVVKECFAQDLCIRDGSFVRARMESYQEQITSVLDQFKREALRLAALDHPGIVRVHQVFSENDTAYIAMDFVEGEDLFNVAENDEERLIGDTLNSVLTQALKAVSYTHAQGLLHRDLAPDNFILNRSNNLTLIDFGSAAEMQPRQRNSTTRLLSVKDGYSPHEFYDEDSEQDPASDVYSLAATFYFLITGSAPPDSQTRLAAINEGHSDPFVPLSSKSLPINYRIAASIDEALSINPEHRLQSCEDWLGWLRGEIKPRRRAHPQISGKALAKVVSSLVADTNDGITAGLPRSMKPEETLPVEDVPLMAEQSQDDEQPVDLFGNPIEDVEAYLREQDRLAKKAKRRVRPKRPKRKAVSRLGVGDPRKANASKGKVEDDDDARTFSGTPVVIQS
ncbi:MAG: serine/threonine-protein kinase [Pseudomonadota bacterium]